MGALVAVLQTDDSLLRCQLERLRSHVSLRGEGDPLPLAYGFGYYAAGNVLLGKRPSGAPAPLSLPELVGKVDSRGAARARALRAGPATKDENTQPFRYRRWLFAHDGDDRGLRGRPADGSSRSLPDHLRRQIAGDSPSEHAFMVSRTTSRTRAGSTTSTSTRRPPAARSRRPCGSSRRWARDAGEQKPSQLVFVATNGRIMVATRRGGPLFYALYEGIVPCALDEHRRRHAGERPSRSAAPSREGGRVRDAAPAPPTASSRCRRAASSR